MGADKRYSLRVRAIKRRGKNKGERRHSLRVRAVKCREKKQETEKAFSQGSRNKNAGQQGAKTKKCAIRAIRTF